MEFPDALITRYGSAAALAEAVTKHPLAPRRIGEGAIYQWKARGIPWMWRPVVNSMLSQADDAA